MKIRMRGSVVVLSLVAAGVVGCAAPPAAAPTPSGFASEAEAFAAAEKTYRAYVDALNQVDLSDPSTFEGVYAWTTGELNAGDRKVFSQWHADGNKITGDIGVPAVHSGSRPSATTLTIDVCYDATELDVIDADGHSLVLADRPDVQRFQVELVASQSTATQLAIEVISPSVAEFTC